MNAFHGDKPSWIEKHLWKWEYSPSKQRAWIVDFNGYTICDPTISKRQAKVLCSAHNEIVKAALHFQAKADEPIDEDY